MKISNTESELSTKGADRLQVKVRIQTHKGKMNNMFNNLNNFFTYVKYFYLTTVSTKYI